MAEHNHGHERPATHELSAREEAKYKKKCRDLKRRIGEIEASNEDLVTKLARTKRFIRRTRLERALLLDALAQNVRHNAASDGSPSPPASPSLEAFSLDPANLAQMDVTALSPDQERRSVSPSLSRQPTPMHDHQQVQAQSQSQSGTARPTQHSAVSNVSAGHKEAKSSPAAAPKKPKPPKDPNAPKRPKNAFLLFCELERDSVRAAADPGNGETVDIARELGRVWADMNVDLRKPYRDMYEEDKLRYEKEMSTYEKPKDLTTTASTTTTTTSNSVVKNETDHEKHETNSVAVTPSRDPSPKPPRVGGFTAVNRT